MNRMELPLPGNRVLLSQGMGLLEQLDDGLYAERRGSWAPVGAQYRHILDHYQSFFDGLPSGRIDYDARARNELLETSRSAALEATRALLTRLDRMGEETDRPVMVQMDSGGGPDAPDWRPSSAGRELQFLCSHTVHHFALIQLLLAGSGIQLDPEFGVAPSTLAYQRLAPR